MEEGVHRDLNWPYIEKHYQKQWNKEPETSLFEKHTGSTEMNRVLENTIHGVLTLMTGGLYPVLYLGYHMWIKPWREMEDENKYRYLEVAETENPDEE